MLGVGTGKATEANQLLEALARGRHDHQYFSSTFLNRVLHDGQLEWVENADSTVNVLATANRYGKTTILSHGHAHKGVYKVGAEWRYLDEDGNVDAQKFFRTRYNTIHTAHDYETAQLVEDELRKIQQENRFLEAFIVNFPKSKPTRLDWLTGARTKFRTLGHNASGIDGNSFYFISLDEAGWEDNLETMMDNVIRVRVADVLGMIWLVGTFKPGVSRDFYKYAVKGAAYTGKAIAFDHGGAQDDTSVLPDAGDLDAAIRRYLAEYGIDLDEYADALKGES